MKKPYQTPKLSIQELNPASFAGNYNPGGDPLGFTGVGSMTFGDKKN